MSGFSGSCRHEQVKITSQIEIVLTQITGEQPGKLDAAMLVGYQSSSPVTDALLPRTTIC